MNIKPLPPTFVKKGVTYKILDRTSNKALLSLQYCGKDKVIGYDVIAICLSEPHPVYSCKKCRAFDDYRCG